MDEKIQHWQCIFASPTSQTPVKSSKIAIKNIIRWGKNGRNCWNSNLFSFILRLWYKLHIFANILNFGYLGSLNIINMVKIQRRCLESSLFNGFYVYIWCFVHLIVETNHCSWFSLEFKDDSLISLICLYLFHEREDIVRVLNIDKMIILDIKNTELLFDWGEGLHEFKAKVGDGFMEHNFNVNYNFKLIVDVNPY